MNIINVDINRMNGSFKNVKNIIGCRIDQLRGKQLGMDRLTTVFVISKDFNTTRRAMSDIHQSLSLHSIPHTYSIAHERINLA